MHSSRKSPGLHSEPHIDRNPKVHSGPKGKLLNELKNPPERVIGPKELQERQSVFESEFNAAAKTEIEAISNQLGDSVLSYLTDYFWSLNKTETIENQLTDLVRLRKFFENLDSKANFQWTEEKFALLLELIKQSDSRIPEQILSFIKQNHYGWQSSGGYRTHMPCLNNGAGDHCRSMSRLKENAHDLVQEIMTQFDSIFFSGELRLFITHIFSYCITALFASRLRESQLYIPYPIHIRCDRGSGILELVDTIARICDINRFPGGCAKCTRGDDAYTKCMEGAFSYAPQNSVRDDMEFLMKRQDIPTIICDFGCERDCSALLNRISRLSSHGLPLSDETRFNLLPIFVSDKFLSDSPEVIAYDCLGMKVDTKVIEKLNSIADWFGRWVYSTIRSSNYPNLNPYDPYEGVRDTSENVDSLREKLNQYIRHRLTGYLDDPQYGLDRLDILNAGTLAYFFDCFLDSAKYSVETDGRWTDDFENINDYFAMRSNSAFRLIVDTYSSQKNDDTIDIAFDASKTPQKKGIRIQERGRDLLTETIEYYAAYGVHINPVKNGASFINDRYVFRVTPKPGTKIASVKKLQPEVQMHLQVPFFRVQDASGGALELVISDKPISESDLQVLLNSPEFQNSDAQIPYAVGHDALGNPVIAAVEDFPHLWVCGASSSGKSSALHSMIMSIVSKQPVDKVKLLLMDFGDSDLDYFENVPHMLLPGEVISSQEQAITILRRLEQLMKDREAELRSLSPRDRQAKRNKRAYIVCLIDELPELVTHKEFGDEAVALLETILHRGRSQKIRLILASQTAKKESIKLDSTNISSKIALRCAKLNESVAIIGKSGAEKLCTKGSMYFKDGNSDIRYVQGSYISPADLLESLERLESSYFSEGYESVVLPELQSYAATVPEISAEFRGNSNSDKRRANGLSDDELLRAIISDLVASESETLSGSEIKESHRVGYIRAARLLRQLVDLEVLNEPSAEKQPHTVNLDTAKSRLGISQGVDSVSDVATSTSSCIEESADTGSNSSFDSATVPNLPATPASSDVILSEDFISKLPLIPRNSLDYKRASSALNPAQKAIKQEKLLQQERDRLLVSKEYAEAELHSLGAVPAIVFDDVKKASAVFYAFRYASSEDLQADCIEYKGTRYPVFTVSDVLNYKIQLHLPKQPSEDLES